MQPNLSDLINHANQTNDLRSITERCTQFLEANPTFTWQTIREVSIILLLRALNFPQEPVDTPLTAATMTTFVQAVAASTPDFEPDDADNLDEEEEEEERPKRRTRHNHSDEEDDSIVVSDNHVEYESNASSESEYDDSSD